MADAVDFKGSNRVYRAPPNRDDVSDLHTFVNGSCIVSAWKLRPEELEEVNKNGGLVFLSSFSGETLFPVFVGSESVVRSVVVDYGGIWEKNDG